MKKLLLLILLLALALPAFALTEVKDPRLDPAVTVVRYTPNEDHDFLKSVSYERELHGNIDRVKKGVGKVGKPLKIVHRPNSIIRSLKAGETVDICLKQYPDRNSEYYIVAIFNAE